MKKKGSNLKYLLVGIALASVLAMGVFDLPQNALMAVQFQPPP